MLHKFYLESFTKVLFGTLSKILQTNSMGFNMVLRMVWTLTKK
jgi:hypothetical protein